MPPADWTAFCNRQSVIGLLVATPDYMYLLPIGAFGNRAHPLLLALLTCSGVIYFRRSTYSRAITLARVGLGPRLGPRQASRALPPGPSTHAPHTRHTHSSAKPMLRSFRLAPPRSVCAAQEVCDYSNYALALRKNALCKKMTRRDIDESLANLP